MRLKSILLSALICLATTSEFALARNSILHDWTRYKKQYGKVCEALEDDLRRFSLFMTAKEEIRQHDANEQTSY